MHHRRRELADQRMHRPMKSRIRACIGAESSPIGLAVAPTLQLEQARRGARGRRRAPLRRWQLVYPRLEQREELLGGLPREGQVVDGVVDGAQLVWTEAARAPRLHLDLRELGSLGGGHEDELQLLTVGEALERRCVGLWRTERGGEAAVHALERRRVPPRPL